MGPYQFFYLQFLQGLHSHSPECGKQQASWLHVIWTDLPIVHSMREATTKEHGTRNALGHPVPYSMVFWAPWELPSLEVNLCRGGSSPLFWAWGPCMNYGNILFTLSSHLGKNISNIWWSLSQITWSCIQAFLHSLHSSLVFPMYCELLINIFSPVVNLCHGVLFFLLAPGSYHREGS